MKRKRAGAVRLSDHAYERWKLRVAPGVAPAKRASVADRIRRRIAAELKMGAEVNRIRPVDTNMYRSYSIREAEVFMLFVHLGLEGRLRERPGKIWGIK